LWYAAHIVPYSPSFLQAVSKLVREFIWNSRRAKVPFEVACKPRKLGGLGILPVASQTTAILAQFMTKSLQMPTGPWWAPAARWALQQALTSADIDTTHLLTGAIPRGALH
ncbi:hypothetical protein GGI05_005658, partial [Coemansia sp. RSA 2603]